MTMNKNEPVAWVRRHPDGALTAEFLEDAVIEPVRKKSGAWVPLYTKAPAVDLTHLVNRFLGWKLPLDFAPDCGISIDTEIAGRNGWPSGTNLFNAEQAKQMFEYVTQVTPTVTDFSDGYHGAREDLAIWKKRALEAEELNRKFIADINGQTFMGEPAPAVAHEPVAGWIQFVDGKQTQNFCRDKDEMQAIDKISRLMNKTLNITYQPVYTHPAQPVQADGLRQAALIDLAYINGATAGWNMCVADDESQFKKLTEGVVECVKVLKNTRPQESAQPVQTAACQYCNGTNDVHGIDGEWRGQCSECKPAVAQGEADDSLLLCASDLEHSAIYDSHAEMQDCIRAVALRIKALWKQAPAAEKPPLARLTDDLASSLQTAHFLIEALSQGKEITYSHKSIAMHQIRDSLQRYEDLRKMNAIERVNGGQQ